MRKPAAIAAQKRLRCQFRLAKVRPRYISLVKYQDDGDRRVSGSGAVGARGRKAGQRQKLALIQQSEIGPLQAGHSAALGVGNMNVDSNSPLRRVHAGTECGRIERRIPSAGLLSQNGRRQAGSEQ